MTFNLSSPKSVTANVTGCGKHTRGNEILNIFISSKKISKRYAEIVAFGTS